MITDGKYMIFLNQENYKIIKIESICLNYQEL